MLFAVGLAACGMAAPSAPSRSRTPAPLPSGATELAIETAPATTHTPVNWACPESLIAPVRVVRDADAVVFELVTGERLNLVWPRGFSARLLDGRAEIVAPDGSVIGREGDVLSDMLAGDPSDICEVNSVFYPPAS